MAGGGNTVATYLLYLLLVQLLSYQIAYSITFFAGIAFGYLVNAFWVFEKSPSTSSALAYPLIYVVQYLIGLIMLAALVEIIGISQVYAPIIVVIVTLPAMFLMTKFVFTEKRIYDSHTKH